MEAIGGYFSLELSGSNNYFSNDFVALNSARNCLKLYLIVNSIKKIFIPLFTCDVLLETILELQIDYEFYDVDNNLEPVFDFNVIGSNESVLITNYFGVKSKFVDSIMLSPEKYIIDNAQALFHNPKINVNAFYSPRKFLGVADGGLLKMNHESDEFNFPTDISINRFSHLIERVELGAEAGYASFIENDRDLVGQPLAFMSELTKKILSSVNLTFIKERRIRNFNILHEELKFFNEFDIDTMMDKEDVPIVYPFKVKLGNVLRESLRQERIYCATYWPNVYQWCNDDTCSFQLVNRIVALPIDQRYGDAEMLYMVSKIKKILL